MSLDGEQQKSADKGKGKGNDGDAASSKTDEARKEKNKKSAVNGTQDSNHEGVSYTRLVFQCKTNIKYSNRRAQ